MKRGPIINVGIGYHHVVICYLQYHRHQASLGIRMYIMLLLMMLIMLNDYSTYRNNEIKRLWGQGT
jgi:hypothetical protein